MVSRGKFPHSVTFLSVFSLVPPSTVSKGCSLSFHILIHLSLCGPQLVSACTQLLSFHVLTSPSLYNLQLVSAPCSAAFFSCSDASLPLWSPPHEHPLLSCFLFMPRLVPPSVVSRGCPLLSRFLSVSWQVPGGAPCLVTFFPCPDLSFPPVSRLFFPVLSLLYDQRLSPSTKPLLLHPKSSSQRDVDYPSQQA